MAGKNGVDDLGGALFVAVDLVAVYAVGVHGGAVADDVFEEGRGEVGVHHGHKGVAQLVDGAVDGVLGRIGPPVIAQVRRRGKGAVRTGKQIAGLDAQVMEHGGLICKDGFCTLREEYSSLGVFCFAGVAS